MYHYKRQPASEKDFPFIMDSQIKDDESENIMYGVKMVDGDGSVPLLSMGYPCVELWKEGSSMNPGKARIITREYKHEGTFQVDDPMRQGPLSGEHCDLLGNHQVLEDIIKISTGDTVEKRIYSKIEDIVRKIRDHPTNNPASQQQQQEEESNSEESKPPDAAAVENDDTEQGNDEL
jgi:phospholipid:diacylglycerol acyltransferase